MNMQIETPTCHPGYSVWRWWDQALASYAGRQLHGAYFLVCDNLALAWMQKAGNAHVVCVVDDFGNLVAKP